MKIKYSVTRLTLLAILITAIAPCPQLASAGGTDGQRPIRLFASARFGPIGAIKLNSLSAGAVAIDGRLAHGEVSIWGNELITVVGYRTVSVALDSIGQVTLSRGAIVRLASARASSDDAGYDVLVASIVAGSAEVKLNEGAGAYVEAGRSEFTASRGASFSVAQRFTGAASHPEVTGVRVTVSDREASASASAAAINSASPALLNRKQGATLYLPQVKLGSQLR